jgi:hypothetical protein
VRSLRLPRKKWCGSRDVTIVVGELCYRWIFGGLGEFQDDLFS